MEPRNNLAVIQGHQPDEMAVWQMIERQADVLVKSGMLPPSVKTPAAAVAIMVLGRELGFERMQSFRLIDVINGKPTLNAGGMAAIVQNYCRKHGGYLRVVESTAKQATIEFKRADWPEPHRLTFALEDAERAGLLGKNPTWKAYPQNMLYARAVANACRMGFPDVVAGIYDPDELSDPAPTMRSSAGLAAATIEESGVIDAPALPVGESAAMKRIHAVGRERSLNHEDVRTVVQFFVPEVQSLTDCTEAQLRDVAARIETASDDDLETWLIDWAGTIAEAGDANELAEIAADMRRRGITSVTHQHLLGAYNRRKIDLAKSKAQPALTAELEPVDDVDRFTA